LASFKKPPAAQKPQGSGHSFAKSAQKVEKTQKLQIIGLVASSKYTFNAWSTQKQNTQYQICPFIEDSHKGH